MVSLKTHAISSRLCQSDVKTHAHSNKRLAQGKGREEESREGGEEERRRGGEEEGRRGGEKQRRRGGRRREGGEEGILAAMHTGF